MKEILVIHPDLATRDELIFVLQRSGFAAVGATESQEALADIERRRPNLIIMAENSHRLNGNELCVRIRELCHAPIIVLGQEQEETAGINFLEMGADVYLTSPLNTRELLARVRSLLRRAKEYFKEYG